MTGRVTPKKNPYDGPPLERGVVDVGPCASCDEPVDLAYLERRLGRGQAIMFALYRHRVTRRRLCYRLEAETPPTRLDVARPA